MAARKPLPEIGWREWVSLPKLGIRHIKVKVDTGARSSALHAFDMEFVEHHGREYVRFGVHPKQRTARGAKTVEAPLLAHRRVRDSGGSQTYRPVIETEVELLGERWPIELTLVARDEMGFRMLLGRQAVRGRFVVNPASSYRGGKPRRRKTRSGKRDHGKGRSGHAGSRSSEGGRDGRQPGRAERRGGDDEKKRGPGT